MEMTKKKKFCSLIYLIAIPVYLFSFVVINSSQTASRKQKNEIIDDGIPSIYLSYVGKSEINENCSSKKQTSYLLKLHNNSPYLINIDANPVLDSTKKRIVLPDRITEGISLADGNKVTDLCYQTESILKMKSAHDVEKGSYTVGIPITKDVPEIPIACQCAWSHQSTRQNDSYPGIWIQPGSSVVFSIPQQYLKEDQKLYTLFNYVWEFKNGLIKYNEPHHQVFFYFSDIAK